MRIVFKPAMLSASLIAMLSLAAPVQGQSVVDASDPATIMEIARGFGSALMERDDQGDPMILGRIDGVRYVVVFYGCVDGAACGAIQMIAAWDNPGDISLQTINDWNLGRFFGRAYLDEQNDPILDMVINLEGGVTVRNLDDSFDWWRTIIAEFSDELNTVVQPE